MSENISIKPHGGTLVNRITNTDPTGLFSITISEDVANDVENIADGIFSPLEGFLGQQDFESFKNGSDKKFFLWLKESGNFLKEMHFGYSPAVNVGWLCGLNQLIRHLPFINDSNGTSA